MTVQATSTPILLIVFNRPDKVRQLLTALATIKPKKVYVAADGPRTHKQSDVSLCAEVRALIEKISWPCEVITNFQPENLGCKLGVSTAISWFFAQEEYGIILEDDCIPSASFFTFATELLHRYHNDERIMHISGSSFIQQNKRTNSSTSYYFSKISLIWGWATWSRAWEKYDIKMSHIDELYAEMERASTFGSKLYRYFWISLFKHLNDAQVNTWDGQWMYSILKHDGVCITPATNLIENIGFDSDATHTTEAIEFARPRQELSFPLTHPDTVSVDTRADKHTMQTAFLKNPKQKLYYFIKSRISL
jgi:hypothetical protein